MPGIAELGLEFPNTFGIAFGKSKMCSAGFVAKCGISAYQRNLMSGKQFVEIQNRAPEFCKRELYSLSVADAYVPTSAMDSI